MKFHSKEKYFMMFIVPLTALILLFSYERVSVGGAIGLEENQLDPNSESLKPIKITNYQLAVKKKPPFLESQILSEKDLNEAIDAGLGFLKDSKEASSVSHFLSLNEISQKSILNNWIDPYPVAWSNMDKELLHDELVSELFALVYNVHELEWPFYRITHEFKDAIKVNGHEIVWLDLVASPSSALEHQKQPVEWSRLYESVGFVGIKRTKSGKSEICSVPTIGQNDVQRNQHIVLAGLSKSEPKTTDRALSLKNKFLKHQLPPDMHLAVLVSENIDAYCREYQQDQQIVLTNFPKVSDTEVFYNTFAHYEAVLLFELLRVKNPMPDAPIVEAIMIRQQSMFRRGDWEDCPQAEERSWKLFVDREEGLVHGGQYFIDEDGLARKLMSAVLENEEEPQGMRYVFKAYHSEENMESLTTIPFQALAEGSLPPGPWRP